jgi:hypothetical protein
MLTGFIVQPEARAQPGITDQALHGVHLFDDEPALYDLSANARLSRTLALQPGQALPRAKR